MILTMTYSERSLDIYFVMLHMFVIIYLSNGGLYRGRFLIPFF